jgi:hypothetical protein
VAFELLDTQGEIYGNTAVYLVRDCGIYVGKTPDLSINWVSHDVDVEGFTSNLTVVTGLLSDLAADGNYDAATCLGAFSDTKQVVDGRPDPPVGDGFYYLVNGTCASPIGFGNASPTPNPRDGLAGVCPWQGLVEAMAEADADIEEYDPDKKKLTVTVENAEQAEKLAEEARKLGIKVTVTSE